MNGFVRSAGKGLFRVVAAVLSTLQEKGINAAGFPLSVPRQQRTVQEKKIFLYLFKIGWHHGSSSQGRWAFLFFLIKKGGIENDLSDIGRGKEIH